MNNDSSTAKLVDWLRAEIRGLGPGDRLPSTRFLVESHGVSPVTVSRALAGLASEGLIISRPGSGTFVAPALRTREVTDLSWQTVALADGALDAEEQLAPLFDPPYDDNLISLATGYLHASLMPTRGLAAALSRTARLPDVWERPPVAGIHGLRTWFAALPGPGSRRETFSSQVGAKAPSLRPSALWFLPAVPCYSNPPPTRGHSPLLVRRASVPSRSQSTRTA